MLLDFVYRSVKICDQTALSKHAQFIQVNVRFVYVPYIDADLCAFPRCFSTLLYSHDAFCFLPSFLLFLPMSKRRDTFHQNYKNDTQTAFRSKSLTSAAKSTPKEAGAQTTLAATAGFLAGQQDHPSCSLQLAAAVHRPTFTLHAIQSRGKCRQYRQSRS